MVWLIDNRSFRKQYNIDCGDEDVWCVLVLVFVVLCGICSRDTRRPFIPVLLECTTHFTEAWFLGWDYSSIWCFQMLTEVKHKEEESHISKRNEAEQMREDPLAHAENWECTLLRGIAMSVKTQ